MLIYIWRRWRLQINALIYEYQCLSHHTLLMKPFIVALKTAQHILWSGSSFQSVNNRFLFSEKHFGLPVSYDKASLFCSQSAPD